jgi:capsular exopolysaccharide synthesis family protein
LYKTNEQLPPYQTFKNTQAALIVSDVALNRAADELKEKELIFFQPGVDLAVALHRMTINDSIKIVPDRRNEFIYIRMTTDFPKDAESLVDAILRGYMSIVVSEENRDDDEKLSVLEKRRRMLEDQMEQQRLKIRQRVDEYGSNELSSRQEIMLEQVATLQNELVTVSIRRIMLSTQVNIKEKELEGDLAEEDFGIQRTTLIENDPLVKSLRADVLENEDWLREAELTMREVNPELKRRRMVLTDLKRQLEKRRSEVSAQIEEELKKESQIARKGQLEDLKVQLDQTVLYEKGLQEKLSQLDSETIGLGRKQFEIDDYREQFDQTKLIYNDLCRRIEEINIERSRQPRIAIGSFARSVEAKGKRRKMAATIGLASLALGVFLALLLDRLDRSVKKPDEVAKRIGVRIIGTTTSPHDVDRKYLPQQLTDDYQTIRANIGLLDDAEHTGIIAVTSPGMGDGKTTFSVNLATSFAQSGKRTLLIDGDLRKPDVGLVLKLPTHLRGLQDYLFGANLERAVHKVDGMKLYVLAADSRNTADALEMLSTHESINRIKSLRNHFDKIIIDTPPVLAFADTLLWARIADAVLLTSFIGHTSKDEMKEAIRRLNEIHARILGTVVNNVKMSNSYRRYGYGYGYGYGVSKAAEKKRRAHKNNENNTLLIAANSDSTGFPTDKDVKG